LKTSGWPPADVLSIDKKLIGLVGGDIERGFRGNRFQGKRFAEKGVAVVEIPAQAVGPNSQGILENRKKGRGWSHPDIQPIPQNKCYRILLHLFPFY
jgi:hypothetical protein